MTLSILSVEIRVFLCSESGENTRDEAKEGKSRRWGVDLSLFCWKFAVDKPGCSVVLSLFLKLKSTWLLSTNG